jgi:diketogulonate reductase-like aldo/keto reductase
MPIIGLGTYQLNKPEQISEAILRNGYRLLDCASFY